MPVKASLLQIKNLPAMKETEVQSLGQEDPLEKGMATHCSINYCLENSMDYIGHGVAESDTTEQLSLSLSFITLKEKIQSLLSMGSQMGGGVGVA